ncbi:MAG: hypothetical protein P8Y00_12450, partial [Deltaproteobacteria bacterium]
VSTREMLWDFFGSQRPVIGFSTLSGRQDLVHLAGALRNDGAITFLAGPQSDVDYGGEVDWKLHPHRFRGFSKEFSFALHGPAEQILPLLNHRDGDLAGPVPGHIQYTAEGKLLHHPEQPWNSRFLGKVTWDNLFILERSGFTPLKVSTGQVIQQIGCPYAARGKWIEIDAPVSRVSKRGRSVRLFARGCSFCDVAVDKGFCGRVDMNTVLTQIEGLPAGDEVDKGFCGRVDMNTVLTQIEGLPAGDDGRKIPFELINENGCGELSAILRACRKRRMDLSRINLTVRADWFIRSEGRLREALELARSLGTVIHLGSMGFESFDDTILKNLNKGVTAAANLRAVALIRRFKEDYPDHWSYSRSDGSVHGFIHPTPWDTEETWKNIQSVFREHTLLLDIIPDHSVPLIIHHASLLGDWIRKIEQKEGRLYNRLGTIIEWW